MNAPRAYAAAVLLAATVMLSACSDDSSPLSPRLLSGVSAANGATRDHLEFDDYNDFDLVVSCVNGTTHWQGTIHVVIDVVTNISVTFDPSYFVQTPNGTRYHPSAGFSVKEHHLDGPVTLIAGTASGVFKSADGDTLPLGFHVQVLYDRDGNAVVDWKFIGVCP